MATSPEIEILDPDDALLAQAHDLLRQQWGDSVVSLGRAVDPYVLPVRVARAGGVLAGVATYLIEDDEFEVVALAATGEVRGTGHALMMDLLDMARQAGVRRMRLVTTNDNLRAIGFYQIIGMTIARVGINAVEQARKLKPDIPRTGENGIPIRDEIEFEYLIKD
jgi:GNAT superfamily N-acetyltransferase